MARYRHQDDEQECLRLVCELSSPFLLNERLHLRAARRKRQYRFLPKVDVQAADGCRPQWALSRRPRFVKDGRKHGSALDIDKSFSTSFTTRRRREAFLRLDCIVRVVARSGVWMSGAETGTGERPDTVVKASLLAPATCFDRRETAHSSATYLDPAEVQPDVCQRLLGEWCRLTDSNR
jgi:hypothetical protein